MLADVSGNSGRPETSDTNYQVTRCNMPEEQTAQLHHCERLITRMYIICIPMVQPHLLDFGTGMFYFIPPHPLSCSPPPKQYLFTFAVCLHRNPWTLVTVKDVRMIRKLNKRQHDFKQINCNSFRIQISRPKHIPCHRSKWLADMRMRGDYRSKRRNDSLYSNVTFPYKQHTLTHCFTTGRAQAT